MGKSDNPIIVALDGISREEALRISTELRDSIGGVKVNDLLDLHGVEIIRALKDLGLLVMADPKIKDIPRTVARRVGHYVKAGADLVTIMADNSAEALSAAVETTKGSNTRIVAVTVLTSIDPEECIRIYGKSPKETVFDLAKVAAISGVPAIVCSPKELEVLKGSDDTKKLICITPGIRLAEQGKEDQKRTDTPGAAIRAGADFLVIGSAILKPPEGTSMSQAAANIMLEVATARADASIKRTMDS